MTALIATALTITGLTLLWRNFRYDTDNPLHKHFERLPYLLRKPITCGLCITYWITFITLWFYNPLHTTLSLDARSLTLISESFMHFVASWMITGTVAVAIVYTIETFYQVSHTFAHRAHHEPAHDHVDHK